MGPAVAQPHEEFFSNGTGMYPLTDQDLNHLSLILVVARKNLGIETHPLDDTFIVVTAEYPRINVASAIASHLNNDPDFYRIPGSIDRRRLHYTTNKFAFVDTESFGHKLCLTMDQPKEKFIQKLSQRIDEIQYVVRNPDILFLRPHLDFQTAKSHLNAGYEISVLSL
jgi:hypothetical protein